MLHNLTLVIAVSTAILPGISALNATPFDSQLVHIAGSNSRQLEARVTRDPVLPSPRFGVHLKASDVVMAVDNGDVHYRYGLAWETPRHQFLSVSVAAWSRNQATPAYSVVSGRTAASRKQGVRSFDVPLPAPGTTIQAKVIVLPNGRARIEPHSIRVGAAASCHC
jgi:hypothetical protein